jgi:hypothetical protein
MSNVRFANTGMQLPAQFVLLLLALTGCSVPPVQRTAVLQPLTVPMDTIAGELALGPVVAKMAPTESTAIVQYGWFCKEAPTRQPSIDRLPFSRPDLLRGFSAVLEPLRYRTQKSPDSVFASTPPANYVLGAAVTKLQSSVCFPFSGSPNLNVGDPTAAKGSVFVEIRWELFSSADRSVVYASTTRGTYDAKEAEIGGYATIALNAFIASLRNLAAEEGFRAAVTRPKPRSQ